MKTVCRTMGLARSHVRELSRRDDSWTDGRRHRTPKGDAQLLAELRQEIAQLPSYGYRRACALVNRQRSATGDVRVNAKSVYRVMAQAGLLLPKAPRRRHSSRVHEGRVAVAHSDLRWCSDGLEIKCDSGQTVTATFTKDCCDREVLAWRAWEGKGLPGEPVREMLIEAGAALRGGRCHPCRPPTGVPERQRWCLHRGRNASAGTLTGPQAHQHTCLQSAKQRHG